MLRIICYIMAYQLQAYWEEYKVYLKKIEKNLQMSLKEETMMRLGLQQWRVYMNQWALLG